MTRPDGSVRYALWITATLGLLGFAAFLMAWQRFDDAPRWGWRVTRGTSVEGARAAALRFGIETTGPGEKVELRVRTDRPLPGRWENPLPVPGISPVDAFVRLRARGEGHFVVVGLDAWGRPLSILEEGGRALAEAPGEDEARRNARAWLALLAGPEEAARYGPFEPEAPEGAGQPRPKSGSLVLEAAREGDDLPGGFRVTATVPIDRTAAVRILLRARPGPAPPGGERAEAISKGLRIFLGLGHTLLFLVLVGWAVVAHFRRELGLSHGALLAAPFVAASLLDLLLTGGPLIPSAYPGWNPAGYMTGTALAFVLPCVTTLLAWGVGRHFSTKALPAGTGAVDDILHGRLLTRPAARAILAGLLSGGVLALVQYVGPLTGLTPNVAVTGAWFGAAGSGWPVFTVVAKAVKSPFFDHALLFGLLVPFLETSRIRWLRWPLGCLAGIVVLTQPREFLGPGGAWAALLAGLVSFVLLRVLWGQFGLLAVLSAGFSAAVLTGIATFASNASVGFRGLSALGYVFFLLLLLVVVGVAFRGMEVGVDAGRVVVREGRGADRLRLGAEMEAARKVQERLLSAPVPAVPGFEISVHCRPALQVGGDLHAVLSLPGGRVGLVAADVAGKGLPASLFMGLTKGVLMVEAEESADPLVILAAVNATLWSLGNRKTFVTASLAVLDPGTRRVALVRAGHAPALLLRRASSRVEVVTPAGLGLGCASPRLFEGSTSVEERQVEPGDVLVLLSDGVTEAMDPSSREYGMERLTALLERSGAESADAVREGILADLAAFTGDALQSDDVTLVVLRASDRSTAAAGSQTSPSIEARTRMFGAVALAEGELAAMDGGIHGVPGHTVKIPPDGTARWERRTGSVAPNGREGSGLLSLDGEELAGIARWRDAAWRLADPANAGKAPDPTPRPPHWVWAVFVRRGSEVRALDGGGYASTDAPGELRPLLDWMRSRVDAASEAEPGETPEDPTAS